MKAAVVGLGSMGRNHARVLHEMDSLAAVVDLSEAARDECRRRFGVPGFETIDDLLAAVRDLDAAVVATPTATHEEVCLQLLSEGLPLLLEKPVAEDEGAACRIAAAAAAAGVVVQIGHIERFNPALLAMRDKVAQGIIGDVYSLTARRVGPFPPRVRDVGVTNDLAVHDLDIARMLLGQEITTVFARAARRIHQTQEDLISILGSTDREVVVNFEINWLSPRKVRETTLLGSNGMLVADTLSQDLYHYTNSFEPAEWMPILRGVNEGDMTRFALRRHEPLRAQAEAFVRTLATGLVEGATLADGIAAIRLAEAAVRSSMSQAPVYLTARTQEIA